MQRFALQSVALISTQSHFSFELHYLLEKLTLSSHVLGPITLST